jgi:hypothetical protein
MIFPLPWAEEIVGGEESYITYFLLNPSILPVKELGGGARSV